MEQEIYYSNNELSIIKSNGPFSIQTATNTQIFSDFEGLIQIKSPTFIGEKILIGNYKIVGEQIKIDNT